MRAVGGRHVFGCDECNETPITRAQRKAGSDIVGEILIYGQEVGASRPALYRRHHEAILSLLCLIEFADPARSFLLTDRLEKHGRLPLSSGQLRLTRPLIPVSINAGANFLNWQLRANSRLMSPLQWPGKP